MLKDETLEALEMIIKAHKRNETIMILDENFEGSRELTDEYIFPNGIPKMLTKSEEDTIVNNLDMLKYFQVLLERRASYWFIIKTIIIALLKLLNVIR